MQLSKATQPPSSVGSRTMRARNAAATRCRDPRVPGPLSLTSRTLGGCSGCRTGGDAAAEAQRARATELVVEDIGRNAYAAEAQRARATELVVEDIGRNAYGTAFTH
jgi:hypothetical protein